MSMSKEQLKRLGINIPNLALVFAEFGLAPKQSVDIAENTFKNLKKKGGEK
jgi:hypothetical protein